MFYPFAVQAAQTTSVPVDHFVLTYGRAHPGLPDLTRLATCAVKLELRDGIYDRPTTPTGGIEVKVGDAFGNAHFSEAALVAVFQALVAALNERGIFGVFVVPSRADLDPQTREDLRSPGQHDLTLVIWVSEVSQIRSVAKGQRFPSDRSINNPKHRRIVSHSPLKAASAAEPGSLLFKSKLEGYLERLNRHPGRRVEAAISSTSDPGGIVLDYLVNEKRPWFLYAQVSNTGTSATSPLRERVGFTHDQVTNHDDILALDFVTSSLSAGNAGFLSYDYPIFFPDKLRVKALVSYGNFTAKDVGIALEKFTGTSWSAGLETTASPFRFYHWSIDATLGAAWQNVEVNNRTIGLDGSAPLFTPYFTLRFDRATETMQTDLSIGFETNLATVAGTTANNIFALGRLQSDVDYQLAKVEFSHSMYLEPLLFPHGFVEGRNWKRTTLAHEVAFTLRGQQVLDDKRLIPQKQLAIGGAFSVRGYPESVSGGDNVGFASAEYRFHIPRAFRPYAESKSTIKGRSRATPPTYFGKPFYWRPPQVYAMPDWDLLFRTFVDAGYTQIVRPRPEETNRRLLGAGVGLELQARGMLSLRADWGMALDRVKTGNADVASGSSRVHLMASLMW
jgi:hypothetical protein